MASPRVDPDQPSPHGLANKLGRVAWACVYHGLFRWTPSPLHGVRRLILRLFGARIAPEAYVYGSVRIWAPWNLTMGRQACLAPGVICYNVAPIRVGARATVSQGAHLCGATHDYRDPLMPLVPRPITIGREAWVAAEAFVSPGVSIGPQAVVGARSVVTKDVPAGWVCAGNPCRPLKRRWE